MKAVYLLDLSNYNRIYSDKTKERINKKVDVLGRYDLDELENVDLKDVEIVFSGWGGIQFTDYVLSKLPKLKVIFFGAGSIKRVQTKEMWNKNIRITSASSVNAIPVAQYCLSVIQLASKNFFRLSKKSELYKNDVYDNVKGFYGRKIGIISYSKVGRELINYLKNTNNDLYLYDPYLSADDGEKIGAKVVGLDYIFKNCDIVSLNSPLLEETVNMINKDYLDLMKKDAVFINTARGKIVNHCDLIEVFSKRKDLLAILDVTYPEPLDKSSKLLEMENVIITPHIAGSLGDEIYSMGDLMYNELLNYLNSGKLDFEITEKDFKRMA